MGTPDVEAVRFMLNLVPISTLFKMMAEVTDEEMVKKLVRVVKVVLDSSDGLSLLQNKDFSPFLLGGLSHSEYKIRLLTLEQLCCKFIRIDDTSSSKEIVHHERINYLVRIIYIIIIVLFNILL